MENNEYASASSSCTLRMVVPENIAEISKTNKGKSTGKIDKYLRENGELSFAVKPNTREDLERFNKAYPEEPEIGE